MYVHIEFEKGVNKHKNLIISDYQYKKDILKEGLLLYQLNRIEMIEGVEYKDIRIFMLLVSFGYKFESSQKSWVTQSKLKLTEPK